MKLTKTNKVLLGIIVLLVIVMLVLIGKIVSVMNSACPASAV